MTGDDIVKVIVVNIRLGGVCKHFHHMFENKRVPATRLFLYAAESAAHLQKPPAPAITCPGNIDMSHAKGGECFAEPAL